MASAAAESRATAAGTEPGVVEPTLKDRYRECLTCRVIGTGALAATGIYALNQSRAHAPGSPAGKKAMAGVGVCTCLLSPRFDTVSLLILSI